MGRLADLNKDLDLLKGIAVEPEPDVKAITGALGAIAAKISTAEPTDLAGIESAIAALAESLDVKVSVEAPAVNIEPPVVNIEPLAVTIEAPNVDLVMPEQGVIEYVIHRNSEGFMTSVVARPYEPMDAKDDFTIS